MREGIEQIVQDLHAAASDLRHEAAQPAGGCDPRTLAAHADALLQHAKTLTRLPLATPEQIADSERLDWMERDHNARVYPALRVQAGADVFGVSVKHEEGSGFSPNGKLREAIDAARAARTEGHTNG